VSAKV
jgi:hypothetical protein